MVKRKGMQRAQTNIEKGVSERDKEIMWKGEWRNREPNQLPQNDGKGN